jgi:hypothetical protein
MQEVVFSHPGNGIRGGGIRSGAGLAPRWKNEDIRKSRKRIIHCPTLSSSVS